MLDWRSIDRWSIDWLIDLESDWLIYLGMVDCLFWMNEWMNEWLIDWLIIWLIE